MKARPERMVHLHHDEQPHSRCDVSESQLSEPPSACDFHSPRRLFAASRCLSNGTNVRTNRSTFEELAYDGPILDTEIASNPALKSLWPCNSAAVFRCPDKTHQHVVEHLAKPLDRVSHYREDDSRWCRATGHTSQYSWSSLKAWLRRFWDAFAWALWSTS